MAETAAAVAVEAVTGTATKRSASTAAALACASVLMALADVVGLEVGEYASAQAEYPPRCGVAASILPALWTSLWEAVPSVERFTVVFGAGR